MYDWNGSQEYEVVEGPVGNVQTGSGATTLTLAGRYVRVAGTRAASSVKEGEYIRALLRKSEEGSVAAVIAFQRCGHPGVEYTGPKVTVHFAIIAAVLLVTGLYYGIWWLIVLGAPVVLLRLMFSMQETSTLRRFEAYCRTSPIGSLRL
jgi:hypothetical protein